MDKLWERVISGRHTAVLGPLPAPPESPALCLVRVNCDVPQQVLGPVQEARHKAEAVLGATLPLSELLSRHAAERVLGGLRRRLLGDQGDPGVGAAAVETWNHLGRQSERPCAFIFEHVDRADDATLALLREVLRRPGWLKVPLVLSLHGRPEGAAAALLGALRAAEGDDAVLVREEAPEPHAADVEAAGLELAALPPDVLRVLRAGALIGSGFEAALVGALLGIEELAVLELLQLAADEGVEIEDRGEGRLHLPEEVVATLRQSILPSLAMAWHRRLGELLAAPAAARPAAPARRTAAGGAGKSAPAATRAAGPPPAIARPEEDDEPVPAQAVPAGATAEAPPDAPAPSLEPPAPLHWPFPEPGAQRTEELKTIFAEPAAQAPTAQAPAAAAPAAQADNHPTSAARPPAAPAAPAAAAEVRREQAAALAEDREGAPADRAREPAPTGRAREGEARPRSDGDVPGQPEPRPEGRGLLRDGPRASARGSASATVRPETAPEGAPAGRPSPASDARAAAHLVAAGQIEAGAERFLAAAQQAADVGAYPQALAYVREVLRILDPLPLSPRRRLLRVSTLLTLGRVQWQAAGPEVSFTLADALASLEAAQRLLAPADPLELRAEVATQIASVYYDMGDLRSLERSLGELTDVSRALHAAGDAYGAARLLNDQAAVYVRLGDPVQAWHLLEESRRLFERRAASDPGALRELAETYHLMARLPLHVRARPGRDADAIAMGRDNARLAEAAYREVGARRDLWRVRETMGQLELRAGRLDRAAEHLAAAAEAQQGLGDAIGLARTTAALAEVLLRTGQLGQGLALLGESVALNLAKGSPLGLAHNRRSLDGLKAALPPGATTWPQLDAVMRDLAAAEAVLGRIKLPGETD